MTVENYGWTNIEMPYYWDKKLPKVLLNFLKGDKVLDVGCGNGYLVSILLKGGYEAYGIDQAKDGIALANEKIKSNRFFLCDINEGELPEAINYNFDTIMSTEVIEHLFSPDQYIKFCNKYMKIGGDL